MRRFLVLFVALAVLPAGLAEVAHAARHHTSTVTIEIQNTLDGQRMLGQVSGGPPACQVNRRVNVLLGGPGVKPTKVGSDITSSNGDWLVSFDAPLAGYYRAVAVRKTYKRHGVRHICDVAKSPRVLDA